jgi:hypothetical protein
VPSKVPINGDKNSIFIFAHGGHQCIRRSARKAMLTPRFSTSPSATARSVGGLVILIFVKIFFSRFILILHQDEDAPEKKIPIQAERSVHSIALNGQTGYSYLSQPLIGELKVLRYG